MSILAVSASARSKRLCRLSDLRDKLGLSGVSDDAELARLIDATGREFSHILMREPWHQTYRERLPGEGGVHLPLACWPIDHISSLSEDGSAVAAADYEVGGARRDLVYREDGWVFTGVRKAWHSELAGDHNLTYDVTYTAGWLMPNQVTDWAADTDYAVGDWVQESDITNPLLFECTTAGTSGSSEPTWVSTEGSTTTDNSVTWTARGAQKLPRDIEQAALMRAADLYRESLADPMVASESFDTQRIQYRDTQRDLPAGLVSLLTQYR